LISIRGSRIIQACDRAEEVTRLSVENIPLVGIHDFYGEGPLDRPIDIMKRPRQAGVSLKTAHAMVNQLAELDSAVCAIPIDNDLREMARDLKPMNVSVHRRRSIDEPAVFITSLRARHGLSQRELADSLGLDVRTLQNWEQGRNQPDAAVLSLMVLFDQSPDLVRRAVFEVPLERIAESA
jgi:DNA-binding transcriptional regulator YiaG